MINVVRPAISFKKIIWKNLDNRPNMKREKNEIYILCPKKGNPRKHIDVCRQCRCRKKCQAYQGYLQPELPFIFGAEDLKTKEMAHR